MAQRVERWTCDQQVVGSNPTRGKSCVTTLGKLFTPLCASVIKQYNLVPAKGQWCSAAGKGTAGVAECNDNLPPGGWFIVICGLTACTPGSAAGPTLCNEYGKPLPLPFTFFYFASRSGADYCTPTTSISGFVIHRLTVDIVHLLHDSSLTTGARKIHKKLSYRRETRATLCISWDIGLLLYVKRKQIVC